MKVLGSELRTWNQEPGTSFLPTHPVKCDAILQAKLFHGANDSRLTLNTDTYDQDVISLFDTGTRGISRSHPVFDGLFQHQLLFVHRLITDRCEQLLKLFGHKLFAFRSAKLVGNTVGKQVQYIAGMKLDVMAGNNIGPGKK